MPEPEQTGPVAVYGATGYTGQLVAEELERRGAEFVLAGRNRGKLEALASTLSGEVRTATVPLDDAAGLRALLEPCAAVIACAGPFTRHGEPVVAAAADAGTHYLDTTGEQPFMRMVFDRYGERAADTGAILVPAMGFDYVPGDMIAALTAAGMGPLDELSLAYSVKGFGMSRGTMHSGLLIAAGGEVEYRDGALRETKGSVDRGTWEFPPPVGRQRMLRYPGGEQITVPRHVEVSSVSTMFSAATMLPSKRLAPAAPALMPALRLGMRTPLRRVLDTVIDRLPEGPEPETRRASRFMVSCEARAGAAHRRGVVTGADVYGLTAVTTVRGALLAAGRGYDRRGALAPSQAFAPSEFLGALGEFGVEHEVEPLPEGHHQGGEFASELAGGRRPPA
ncbi:MAG TPA: saccharopine dehydrogenase NADP-binding domain-containing protein [Solirubrobacterales bacterium]|nr:saccharopine dehydrogenase NADP-binding domain-containing protein [Solirubrobacterales bacterium]